MPKQPTEEPTQASLTAEKFAVLLDFQTCCARFENIRKYSVRYKSFPEENIGKTEKVDEASETKMVIDGFVPWSTLWTVTSIMGSNSESGDKPVVSWNSWNRGSMLDKLRYFLLC